MDHVHDDDAYETTYCSGCTDPVIRTDFDNEIHLLTQDEADELGVDGRDGAGYYASVDVDWAGDPNISDNAQLEVLFPTSPMVFVETITEHGPGGGWPIIRFTASLFDIVAFVKQYEGME